MNGKKRKKILMSNVYSLMSLKRGGSDMLICKLIE